MAIVGADGQINGTRTTSTDSIPLIESRIARHLAIVSVGYASYGIAVAPDFSLDRYAGSVTPRSILYSRLRYSRW